MGYKPQRDDQNIQVREEPEDTVNQRVQLLRSCASPRVSCVMPCLALPGNAATQDVD